MDPAEIAKFKDFCGGKPNKYTWETRRTTAATAQKKMERVTVIVRKTEKKPDVKERQLPTGDRD